jgi:hypothetical protein
LIENFYRKLHELSVGRKIEGPASRSGKDQENAPLLIDLRRFAQSDAPSCRTDRSAHLSLLGAASRHLAPPPNTFERAARHPPRFLVRIGELFAMERDIKGAPPDVRRRVRQQLAAPKLAALRPWLEAQMRGLASDSALAKACRYPLNRWAAMVRYCGDGLLEISNNLVENALRGIALGRRNWMFVGSTKGGDASAVFFRSSRHAA